jgi:hypothetical protein
MLEEKIPSGREELRFHLRGNLWILKRRLATSARYIQYYHFSPSVCGLSLGSGQQDSV